MHVICTFILINLRLYIYYLFTIKNNAVETTVLLFIIIYYLHLWFNNITSYGPGIIYVSHGLVQNFGLG
jgi:hypothetical protein